LSDRTEYFRRYFQEVIKKRKPGRKRKPPSKVIQVRAPETELEKWRDIAAGVPLSRFVREAVNCYIADIEGL
jgi:hypothetical protein